MTRQARKSSRYFVFNKPYGALCQFTDAGGRLTLADFGPFPGDVYPVGRLDFDSEGLVLLTNDGELAHKLLDPVYSHPRTYAVQVERVPDEAALKKFGRGVLLQGTLTLPAKVKLLAHAPELPPRPVPIRLRKNVATAWLEMTLREGKNRQVRRMTAAVGHPTLRLVRTRIANLTGEGLAPGESRELTAKEVQQLRREVLQRRRYRS
jgi:23S rRNA pseudouridine2457 synthase